MYIFKIHLQWLKFCWFPPSHLGRLCREISTEKGLLDLYFNFSKAWRCWNRNHLQPCTPLEESYTLFLWTFTHLCLPVVSHSSVPNTGLIIGIAQIQSSLMWSPSELWVRAHICSSQMITQPACLVIRGCAQHMLPTALVSLPAIWFLPLKQSFGVSDALHKSLPIAKVCWANGCCWFWEMHGFEYQELRKNSCMQKQCWDKLWTCCRGNERADILWVFTLRVEAPTCHTYLYAYHLYCSFNLPHARVLSCCQGVDYEQRNGVVQGHGCSPRYWLIGCIG